MEVSIFEDRGEIETFNQTTEYANWKQLRHWRQKSIQPFLNDCDWVAESQTEIAELAGFGTLLGKPLDC